MSATPTAILPPVQADTPELRAAFAEAPRGRPDYWLLIITLFLTFFGLIMVYSSSAVVIRDRTGDPTYYLERQAAAVLVGLVGMGLLSRVSTRTISRWAPSVYVACLIALGLVLIPGISHSANGATRWIGVGSLHLQPSEFCKLALILVLADRVARYPGGVQNFRLVLLPLFGIAAPAFVLVMLEPDFGTTALLGLVFGLVLYLGGIPTQWLLTLGVAGTGLAVPFVLYSDYRRDRILSWLNPWLVEQGDGYQVIQSWLALHSGGLTGQGIGGSLAKLHYLPEPWTDFIAAVIGEELGFLGIVALLGCYAFFLWRGVRIARRSRTFYGSIIAGAITLLIGVQAFLNLGVVTGMVPPKGLVLPFISYGSSAVLAHLFGVGLLLAISTESEDAVIEEASRKRHALEPDPTVQPLPQAPADDSGASP